VAAAAAVGAVAVWYAHSPDELPTSDRTLRASARVDDPVYLGVFAPTVDFTRTLTLSGVKVHTTANTEVRVVPWLCRGGGLSVTSDVDAFCDDLVDPEGQTFAAGDSIVLEVSADEAAIAVFDRVRLGYREGLQWGIHEAGSEAIVRIVATTAS
jgi:hypothetical protein